MLFGMEILLNNQTRAVSQNTSVQQLVDELVGEKQNGIAVAINNTVVPKTNWATHVLQTNDQVLLIKATQGG